MRLLNSAPKVQWWHTFRGFLHSWVRVCGGTAANGNVEKKSGKNKAHVRNMFIFFNIDKLWHLHKSAASHEAWGARLWCQPVTNDTWHLTFKYYLNAFNLTHKRPKRIQMQPFRGSSMSWTFRGSWRVKTSRTTLLTWVEIETVVITSDNMERWKAEQRRRVRRK